MKTSLAIAVALAAGVGTPVFAQDIKQDTITINLTGVEQSSVSDTTGIDQGTWSAGPEYYKTSTTKLTDQSVIKYIAFAKYRNAGAYGAKASLVLVQSELSGFFNITPDLGYSEAEYSDDVLDGIFDTDDGDVNTSIANSTDSTYVQLANGRHLRTNPIIETEYPVGHMQPWGQIYVQYTDASGNLECDNVTYFFALSVQECYDCFYMNSFVSTATFKPVTTTSGGPPCCGSASVLEGTGKDSYYLTLSFDNTENNPYLQPDSSCYVGVDFAYAPDGTFFASDGINPDTLEYVDTIRSDIGLDDPYVARFTLNGVMTYTWKLEFLNKTDISPDFIGTGNYVATGYGFIGLFCNLFTGSAAFTEKLVKPGLCCDGTYNDYSAWYGWWYGVGAEYTYDDEDDINTMYYFGFYPTPMNVSTSLTYHENFNGTYPFNVGDFAPAAWVSPAINSQSWVPFESGY